MKLGLAIVVTGLLCATAQASTSPFPVAVAFDAYLVRPGDAVTLHVDRAPDGRSRAYLVKTTAVRSIRSRLDRRLYPIGTFRIVKRHGMLRFAVPAVPAGRYTAWCDRCGRVKRITGVIEVRG